MSSPNAPSLRDLYVNLKLDISNFSENMELVDIKIDETADKIKEIGQETAISFEPIVEVTQQPEILSEREEPEKETYIDDFMSEMAGILPEEIAISEESIESINSAIADIRESQELVEVIQKMIQVVPKEETETEIPESDFEKQLEGLANIVKDTGLQTQESEFWTDAITDLNESFIDFCLQSKVNAGVNEQLNERIQTLYEATEKLSKDMEEVVVQEETITEPEVMREVEEVVTPEAVTTQIEPVKEIDGNIVVSPTFNISMEVKLTEEELRGQLIRTFEEITDTLVDEVMDAVSKQRENIFGEFI